MARDDVSDNPLMSSAIHLRSRLFLTRGTAALQKLDVLRPFLEVCHCGARLFALHFLGVFHSGTFFSIFQAVRAPDTTGPIPLVALTAFVQFLDLRCSFIGAQYAFPLLQKK